MKYPFEILLFASFLLATHQTYTWIHDADTTYYDWVFPDGTGVPYQNCGSHKNIIGGPDLTEAQLISRKFYLGDYYSDIILKFKFIAIDGWTESGFSIYINKNLVHQERLNQEEYDDGSLCGDSDYPEKVMYREVHIPLPCKENGIEIGFSARGDAGASFGIQNLRIAAFNRCKRGCMCCAQIPHEDKCIRCEPSSSFQNECFQNYLPPFYEDISAQTAFPDATLADKKACNDEEFIFTQPQRKFSTTSTIQLNTVGIWFKYYVEAHQGEHPYLVYINGQQAAAVHFLPLETGQQAYCGDFAGDEAFVGWGYGTVDLQSKVTEFEITFHNSASNSGYSGISQLYFFGWDRCTGDSCSNQCFPYPDNQKCPVNAVVTEEPQNWDGATISATCDALSVNLGSSDSQLQKSISFDSEYTDFSLEFDLLFVDLWSDGIFRVTVDNTIIFEQHYTQDTLATERHCDESIGNDYKLPLQLLYQAPCKTNVLTITFSSEDRTDSSEFFVDQLNIKAFNRCPTDCNCCYETPYHNVCADGEDGHTYKFDSDMIVIWYDQADDIISSGECGEYSSVNGAGDLDNEYLPELSADVSYFEEFTDIFIVFEWIAIDSWSVGSMPTQLQLFVNDQLIHTETSNYRDAFENMCKESTADKYHYTLASYHSPYRTKEFRVRVNISSESKGASIGIISFNAYGVDLCRPEDDVCGTILVDSPTRKPFQCIKGYGMTNDECISECDHPHCNECPTSPNHCSQCMNGFFTEQGFNVISCESSCEEGYYADPISGKCVLNCDIPGCQPETCVSGQSCGECFYGYYSMFFSSGNLSCVSDDCGYEEYKPSPLTGQCEFCPSVGDACTSCTESENCLSCKEGYYLEFGSCYECEEDCYACTASKCLITVEDHSDVYYELEEGDELLEEDSSDEDTDDSVETDGDSGSSDESVSINPGAYVAPLVLVFAIGGGIGYKKYIEHQKKKKLEQARKSKKKDDGRVHDANESNMNFNMTEVQPNNNTTVLDNSMMHQPNMDYMPMNNGGGSGGGGQAITINLTPDQNAGGQPNPDAMYQQQGYYDPNMYQHQYAYPQYPMQMQQQPQMGYNPYQGGMPNYQYNQQY